MSQLELKNVSKDIIDRVEDSLESGQTLPKVIDDYFILRLKQAELEHAEVDPRLYEGLRAVVKDEVLPLYQRYRLDTAPLRERKQNRKLWRYVLGTVVVLEVLEITLTRGRAIAPQVFIATAILNSFLGFILFTAAQYVDDRRLAFARRRLEKSIEGLDHKLQTDIDYDQRRQLLDADILGAEALEILTHYDRPEAFWRDYHKVRQADPTVPAALKQLGIPAFDRFLRAHVDGQQSAVARQHRFNRLFIQAQEFFISRDRENYALNHVKALDRHSS